MLNKVLLIGRIASEPQFMVLESGTKIGTFAIAYNRSYKDKDGNWKVEAHFFDVKVFNGLNEKLQKLQKGDLILVEGRLSQERWTTQDGKTVSKIRIIAEKIQLLRKKLIPEEQDKLIEKELGLDEELKVETEKTKNEEDDLDIIL